MSNANSRTSERTALPETGHIDLTNHTVRELVALLTQIEDTLRSTPFLVARNGLMVVNPEVAPLLARQRSIVAQLRARRVSWRSGAVAARRHASASWPRPPWT